jgi:hypothetical protein
MEIEALSRQHAACTAGGEASTTQVGDRTQAAARTLKLVVYTAIIGDYDDLVPPPVQRGADDNISYVCLTDQTRTPVPGWTYRPLPHRELSAQSRNRWAKFHPHVLFPEHNASIYVDGNIEILADPMPLAVEVLQQASIGLFDHPVRTCLFDEARECARIGFDWSPVIRAQVQRYALDGLPTNAGLYEGNVIVRAHHDAAVRRAMECWWDEWDNGVKRDQLSLTYVLWKQGLEVYRLGRHDARFTKRYFNYRQHRQPIGRAPSRVLRQVFNRLDLLAFGV